MVRANSAALRGLCLEYGADVVFSEELIAKRLEKTERRWNPKLNTVDFVNVDCESIALRTPPNEKLVIQLGAGDPTSAAAAARHVVGDCIGIDLNMGCPKKFSLTDGMGAALLKDPERAASIVKAIASVKNETTCKIRLLPDDETLEKTASLCRRLQQAGAKAITVHCRYPGEAPEKTKPKRELMRRLFEILRRDSAFQTDCALCVNGDFYDLDDIANASKGPGAADGVLLARPALLNPSIFRRDTVLLPRYVVLRDYMAYAHRYDAHYKNAKYVVMELLAKRRHPSGRLSILNSDPVPDNVTIANVSHANSLTDIDRILGSLSLVSTNDETLEDDRFYDDAYFLRRSDDEPPLKKR